jgi:FkbM family methyltransferase
MGQERQLARGVQAGLKHSPTAGQLISMNSNNHDRWAPAYLSGKLFKHYLLLPDHPSKVRVENWVGKTFFPKGILLSGHGTSLRLDANDWITRIMMEEGNFEGRSLALAKNLLKEGGNFLDIGANFGLYTCVLGNLPGVTCISVDASAEMMNKLEQNLSLNRRVIAVKAQTALASDFGFVKFFCPDQGNKGTSKTVKKGEEVAGKFDILGCVPLNELLAHIGINPIRLLKIDIEGFEMEVFKTFDFDGPYRPANIIMEFIPKLHAHGFTFQACTEFFKAKGYELLNVEGEPLVSETQIPEDNLWLKSR